MRPDVLVIGYGSDLRGDDAAGRRAAEAVAALALPGVEVRSVHQLTPELAADVAGRRLVVFLDASVDDRTLRVRPVAAGAAAAVSTHHVDAGALLALSGLLGTPPGWAWMVSIPAFDLRLGMELSHATAAAVAAAADRVVALAGPAQGRPVISGAPPDR